MLPELDINVPVIVFKTSRNVLQHGMLGIVRSLGMLGAVVFASIEDGWAPVAASRYLSRSFPVESDEVSLLAGLTLLGQKLRRRAIAIPTDDLASIFLAENADRLADWFLLPRIPKSLPRRVANKRDLYFLCRDAGVPCPETVAPTSLDDVRQYAARAQFPVVVKAVEPQRVRQGSRSVTIAHTEAELLSIYGRAANAEGDNLILQEYIPADVGEDWIFQGYYNPQTDCRLAFTGKKLRSYPVFAGITTLGVTAPNEPLIEQTERFLETIGYAGIVDIDYRFDRRDGLYKLLDFNPRPGANFRMFETAEGVDVVRAQHLDLTGRRFHLLRSAERRRFVVEPYDFIASLGYWWSKNLTIGEWFRSLSGGHRELAWFSWDDPAPFATMCMRLAGRGARLTIRSLGSIRSRRVDEMRVPSIANMDREKPPDPQPIWDESADKVVTTSSPGKSSME